MRQALKLHPHSPCSAATGVEVEIARLRAGSLTLRYLVRGKISDLRLPPVAAPARADELWRHTCFEAFMRGWADAGYYEFNFSPSTRWAAYWFSSYRKDMRVATEISAPRIEARSEAECYALHASLALDGLPMLPHDGGWRLGLAALIEETNGRRSYWALAHPPGKPDFHHPDCFACELQQA
jgi:hypothetical protein